MPRIACFGELLLRLATPEHQRFGQTSTYHSFVGGAEANVSVSLARFGHSVEMISAVSDNQLGTSVVAALNSHGVGTQSIMSKNGRIGLYFLETGAVRRPSRIIYDRAESVFSQSSSEDFDWPQLLENTGHVHISGITPATGPGPSALSQELATACSELNVSLSFDGNYRRSLWDSWNGDGPGVIREILAGAQTAFINERDIALLLGAQFASRREAIDHAFDTFPKLKRIAATRRLQSSVTNQQLIGELHTRESVFTSRPHNLPGVVDRIGGGDAFAAGILHGVLSAAPPQYTVDFATAAAAIKHSIPGDFNLTTIEEVEEAMSEESLDVRR